MLKNKIASGINLFGLSIGLTSCLLIALYIRHELSYDRFEWNGDRIVRVIMEYKFDGSAESKTGNFSSVRVAPLFKRIFPEVESAARMTELERVVSVGDKLFSEKNFLFTDPGFFDLFSFRLMQGDQHTALARTHSVVLTESTARKYFGTENPVGKALRVAGDSNLYAVTGVIQDCPSNSQIKFDFLASFSSLGLTSRDEETYWDANYTTYLLLKNKNAIASLQSKLPAFMKKEMKGQGASIQFYLEPFSRIHLYSPYTGFEPGTNIAYIYILAAVALLILVIACFTYINLNTARSLERAKEVGIRKVIGAGRQQLFWQFIGESAILCLLSVALSLIIAVIVLPWFNQLTGKSLQVQSLLTPGFIFFSLSVAAAVSLLAGSYPAFILTGFQPVKVLKGSFKNTGSGQALRKSLIVFQFAISVFLILCTFIMEKQLYYIQHKKLGYNREHILVLPLNSNMIARLPLVKEQFKTNRDVLSVARCVSTPVNIGGGYNMRSSVMPENTQMNVTADPVDEDFIKTTGLQLIAGEGFSEQDMKDVQPDTIGKRTFHFILNESAAKELGWTAQDAVGKKMFLDNSRPGYVRGVVRDFHFESMHNAIRPLVLFTEQRGRWLLVKVTGQNLAQSVSFLETQWKNLVPGRPFEYHFMDDDYQKLYTSELRLGKVMTLFSSIAIALACMGLFGLSSFTARQHIREIGVRRVLGASVGDIVLTLSGNFIVLTLIAILVAFPLAWWSMTRWLQDFTYRTHISWFIFLAAGSFTLFLTIATVSYHAVRAALMNPVKNLRTE